MSWGYVGDKLWITLWISQVLAGDPSDVRWSRPVAKGSVPFGDRGRALVGAPPRPSSVPTPSEEENALRLTLTQHLAQQRALFHTLMSSVGTLETLIYEHDNVELDPTKTTFTLNLPPQTTQTELITGLFASIVVPNLSAAPTISIENAWAKLGGDYINLNAILNSAGGTGGALPGNYAFILRSDNTRQLNLVASADWPTGAYVTFALFGKAVPTMDGGVLH